MRSDPMRVGRSEPQSIGHDVTGGSPPLNPLRRAGFQDILFATCTPLALDR